MIEVLKRPIESDYTSHVAYTRALEQYCDSLESQEPVAIDWERIAKVQNAKLMAMCDEADGFEKLCEVMNKYKATHPPQRTWVGLSMEQFEHFTSYVRADVLIEIEEALMENNA